VVAVVMMPVMVMAMMVVVMVMPVPAVAVNEPRAGVIALLDPAPAVPDRPADQGNRLAKPVVGCHAGNRRARQGLRAAAGKRSRGRHDCCEHQATHFKLSSVQVPSAARRSREPL
jgi:hypothetical protein